jgi:hypothetical protein
VISGSHSKTDFLVTPAINWSRPTNCCLIRASVSHRNHQAKVNKVLSDKCEPVSVLQQPQSVGLRRGRADDFWKPATTENFPNLSYEELSRHAFSGRRAPDHIWKLYVGKRGKRVAIDGFRHVQNPIRYWKV